MIDLLDFSRDPRVHTLYLAPYLATSSRYESYDTWCNNDPRLWSMLGSALLDRREGRMAGTRPAAAPRA